MLSNINGSIVTRILTNIRAPSKRRRARCLSISSGSSLWVGEDALAVRRRGDSLLGVSEDKKRINRYWLNEDGLA